MDIPKRIKDIREAKNLKQYEVAERIGVEPPQYNKWEKRGKKLTIEQLESIAVALGVSLKDILFGEDAATATTPTHEYKSQFEKSQLQKAFVIDNALKFILNLDHLLPQQALKYAIGETINHTHHDYQVFVRCYSEVGNQVFTLATWQKPIAQETALFASAPQDGEYLFDDNQQRQAHQYKDAAFANLQQNLDLWTINFMNLTAFFKAVLQ
jgi:transcriptional regulator with XRE-family HTH domain